MKVIWIGLMLMALGLASCTAPVVVKPHGLKGGVKEPTYPPDGPINCWIQPPHDDLWYPCVQENQPHIH
jgi:hypothetical protein